MPYERIRKLEVVINDASTTEGEKAAARNLLAKLRAKHNITEKQSYTHTQTKASRDEYWQRRQNWNAWQNANRNNPRNEARNKREQTLEQWKAIWKPIAARQVQRRAQHHAANLKIKGQSIRIDFTDPQCTSRQSEYISAICNMLKVDYPVMPITYSDASEFLDYWSPKFVRYRNWTYYNEDED